MKISQDMAVKRFFELARSCQHKNLRAVDVLNAVISFYRDFRVDGANIDEDGDMLLLQWGASALQMLNEPTDLRGMSDKELRFETCESRYIDFSRQVFVAGDDDTDFDDSAIRLGFSLGYAPATGDEKSSNLWINKPTSISTRIVEFKATPFIADLLFAKPLRYVATVGLIG